MFFQILASILCIVLVLIFFKSIWIIPPRHFAIVEYLGTYSKTLQSGFNIVPWPLFYVKYIQWNWERTFVRGFIPSCENCQMDIKPIDCTTKDQLQVKLDGTLLYNINNPRKAVYESDDILNLFYQTSTQAIRNISNQFTYKQLNGQDNVIGSHVKEYINEKLSSKYGITCIEFMIQTLTTNDAVNQKTTELFMASNDREAQLEATRLEAEKIKILREARGMTIEQEIAMEKAKNCKFIIVSSLNGLE
jgi:regulator of protease activity HflC (stomatin/prohibitin superfamily)